jgi:hypothetical protein
MLNVVMFLGSDPRVWIFSKYVARSFDCFLVLKKPGTVTIAPVAAAPVPIAVEIVDKESSLVLLLLLLLVLLLMHKGPKFFWSQPTMNKPFMIPRCLKCSCCNFSN